MSINALIVESSKYNRKMLESVLTEIGVACVICQTGSEALALDNHRQFDFIIVSRHLDDVGAELFLLCFREHHLVGNALTIILTSGAVEEVSFDAKWHALVVKNL